MMTEAAISDRAKAIAAGLVRKERARMEGARIDKGMFRMESLKSGHYWIWLDGSRVFRGNSLFDAEELQPKFIDAMERAGREAAS